MKNLGDFATDFHQNHKEVNYSQNAYYSEFENIACRSKYKYGYYNTQGTIIFSSGDKLKLTKEFIAFSTSRREFISQRNKEKAIGKIESIKAQFSHVPRINQNFSRKSSLASLINSPLPIYENLLLKGQEYEEKSKIFPSPPLEQIRQNLEENIHGSECTFKPQINLLSQNISTTEGEERFQRLYEEGIEEKEARNGQEIVQLSEELKRFQDGLRKSEEREVGLKAVSKSRRSRKERG